MPERSLSPLSPPPASLASEVAGRWMLDGAATFLNHGSFGVRLRDVFAAQQRWRERFEAAPVDHLDRRSRELIDDAKRVLGSFLGMDPDGFGFVTNATDGINAVLRSLRFEPGAEMLTTNHVYPAVRNTMRHLAERAGAHLCELDLPLPVESPEQVLEAITSALTPRTRLVLVDHVTSPTALRFPVERIVERCRERGIEILVDGAHAPGMLPLDVEALGATYYTGNLHKWVCALLGAAFLWVAPERRADIHPNVVSHHLGKGLAMEFSWQGTRDISAWLAARDAVERMDELLGSGSWPRIMAHNHEMAIWVHAMLCRAWDVEPASPIDGSMLGSMASLILPEVLCDRFETVNALHDHLYDECGIEVPVFEATGRWLVRPSCQVYNAPGQYEKLAEAVSGLV